MAAHAQGSADHVALVQSGLPDVPAWWAEAGRPGWIEDAWWSTGTPWSLAGHVVGGWALDEAGPPARVPFPGVTQAQTPLGWFDTLAVVSGGGGAWDGFDAALARAVAERGRLWGWGGGTPRAISNLVLASGSSAYEENSLEIRRGDSLSWLEGGAVGAKRGGVGALQPAGHHLYRVAGAMTWGRQRLEGAFSQRGAAGALAGGEEQSVTGVSGSIAYARPLGDRELVAALGRAYDHHESFGGLLDASRRDARADWGTLEWRGDSAWSARAMARIARVRRQTENAEEQRWMTRTAWMALTNTRRRGPTRLTAGLGAGRDGGTHRTGIAPSLVVEFAEPPFSARLHFERLVVPIWSDLAQGQAPFLQRTWAGGFEVEVAGRGGARGRMSWLMGRTRERAVVQRLPLEDLWLREGFQADPGPFDFGLATVAAEWHGRAVGLGGEGFALLRDDSQVQPNVDPGRGARAFGETRFRVFQGDLDVRLRGELEAVGARQTEEANPRPLAGYATLGMLVAATLGDATLTFGVRNLEDRPRPQVWVDSSTGEPALGTGREYRFTLSWKAFN